MAGRGQAWLIPAAVGSWFGSWIPAAGARSPGGPDDATAPTVSVG